MQLEQRVKHFTDLDGLRGLLALAIVLLHYGANVIVQRASGGFLPGVLFQLAVDFFFVLSGYVLAHSSRGRRIDPIAFAKRRAWRLLPVYFTTLAMMVALGFVASTAPNYLTVRPPARLIVADLFLAYPLVGAEPLNIPAWSITWELYLPILALFLSRAFPLARMSAVLLLIALAASSLLAWRVGLGEHWYATRAVAGLLAGAMLYRQSFAASGRLLWPFLGAMAAIMVFATRWPFLAVLFTPVVCGTILAGTNTKSLLSSPVVTFLGRISYPLYLVHVPVLVAVSLVVDVSGSIFAKSAALGLSIAASALITITIERWGINRGRAVSY